MMLIPSWLRRFVSGRSSRRVRATRGDRQRYRPRIEGLEDRCLLSGPSLDPLLSQFTNLVNNIPAGKSLVVPLTASDLAGDPLTYSVTSSNSVFTPTVLTGNTFLQLNVQWTDQNGAQQTGTMVLELFNDFTPHTAAFIAGLAEAGFYNNLTFHRIVPKFVIQGGDPKGDGTGGPGFQFNNELNKNLIFDGDYQLAMANSGPNTNGSQFFITVGPQRNPKTDMGQLDFGYTLFGQLIRGANVVDGENGGSTVANGIIQVPTDSNSKPLIPVVITSASVIQDTSDAVLLLQSSGLGSATITVTVNDGHGGTSTQHFTARAITDPVDDPPILGSLPVSVATLKNTPVSINVPSFDFSNDPSELNPPLGYFPPPASEGTVSFVGSVLTFMPATNFVGRVNLTLVALESTQVHPDQWTIVIAVGDTPITATGYNLAPTQGQAETYTLASFTNGNSSAKASDFTAAINWGDDHLTNGDIVREPNGTFLVTGTNTYANSGSYPIQVTINGQGGKGAEAVTWKTATVAAANVANTVAFGQGSVTGNEGTTVNVPVTLAQPATGPVFVNYTVTAGTATAGIDFALANGTLFFAPGQQTASIPVVLLNDNIAAEADQTIELTLSSPVNAFLGSQTTATVTIHKIDPPPTVNIVGTAANVQEGASPAVVALRLSSPSADTITVKYTLGGTAGYGTNYTVAGYDTTNQVGTVTFQPGQVVQNLPITILDDHSYDGPLTVTVTLVSSTSSPTNAVLGTNPVFTYTIQNIDPMPVVAFDQARSTAKETDGTTNLSVSLLNASGVVAPSGLPVTVHYAVVGGTAVSGVDYTLAAGTLTFHPGDKTVTIPVTLRSDGLDEPDATLLVRLSQPVGATLGNITTDTLTIQESGTPPSVSFATATAAGSKSVTSVPLTVMLSGPSGKTVTVDYAVTGGSGVNGGWDYNLPNGTLTFLPGQTKKSILLTVVNTTHHEANPTVAVTLSNPVNATVGATPTETYTINETAAAPLTPPPSVNFDVANSSASGDENAASAPVIQVGLTSTPTQPVTVHYAVTGGTAVSGVDYTLAAGTLTFQTGQTTEDSIPLVIHDDGLFGPDKTVRIALSAPLHALLGNEQNFTYTIREKDPPPTVSFSSSNPTHGNEPTALVHTSVVNLVVTLSAKSGLPTVVDYAATGTSPVNGGVDYSLGNGTLTFLPGQTSKVIPITLINNGRDEGNPTIAIALTDPTTGDVLATTTYQVMNVNPLPAVSFQVAAVSSDEAGTPATLAVVLSAPSGQTVTVSYAAVTQGTTALSTDYSLPTTPLTFVPGQTVQYIPVTLLSSGAYEPNEMLKLGLSVPPGGNARLGSIPAATLTIVHHDTPPQVAFASTSASNPSSVASFSIPVTVTGAFAANVSVTVNYTVSVLNSSAAAGGVDFKVNNSTALSGTLTFTQGGATTMDIPVDITSDSTSDADETVIVQLSSPTNAVLGSNVFFTYTITGHS
jgi:cyclophilin family peptidyl-prolyl cis-trans isomerase